jgi:uncharacterized protein involved in type VI secretion and phage assembly
MLYFLTLKDDMIGDVMDHYQKKEGGGVRATYPSLLSEDEIQKVIFDEDYVKYIRSKEVQTAYYDSSKFSVN